MRCQTIGPTTMCCSHIFISTGERLEDKSVNVSAIISDPSVFLITTKSIKSAVLLRSLGQYVSLPGDIHVKVIVPIHKSVI